MTNSALRYLALWMLALGVQACSKSNGDASSSGSHWLACEDDDECEVAGAGVTCGDEGFCVDPFGERVRVKLVDPDGGAGEGGAGGSGGSGGGSGSGAGGDSGEGGSGASSGAGGSGGSGGSDGGGYDPCAGKRCGDACSHCDPSDPTCVETAEVKTCDADAVCIGGTAECRDGIPECAGVKAGDECRFRDDQGAPQCCDGTQHFECSPTACTDSIPGNCFGTYEATRSTLCSDYRPCGGKQCGDACEICDPRDPTCVQSDAVQTCDADGMCVIGGVECPAPVSCDLDGTAPSPCALDQVCCAVGRCGPVVSDQGVCEPVDPKTGDCMACACETQPGGCPICNALGTLIATPDGERPIEELREGDLVLSMHGGVLMPVPVLIASSARVRDHAVVRLTLDSGRQIEVSGSHPTADGRRLDALAPGDTLGALRVVATELVPYDHDRTYDILPASDSATYLAGGALLGSTLANRVP